MAVEKSYARLGLFLVIAMVVVLATGLLFIQRMRSREVIELVTYTQENVAGLDISSTVRYRGVPVGRVSNLQVEPGGRTIEIDFELFTDRPATADDARLHAKPGVHPVDADADLGATRSVTRSAGARRGDATGASPDRRP